MVLFSYILHIAVVLLWCCCGVVVVLLWYCCVDAVCFRVNNEVILLQFDS